MRDAMLTKLRMRFLFLRSLASLLLVVFLRFFRYCRVAVTSCMIEKIDRDRQRSSLYQSRHGKVLVTHLLDGRPRFSRDLSDLYSWLFVVGTDTCGCCVALKYISLSWIDSTKISRVTVLHRTWRNDASFLISIHLSVHASGMRFFVCKFENINIAPRKIMRYAIIEKEHIINFIVCGI